MPDDEHSQPDDTAAGEPRPAEPAGSATDAGGSRGGEPDTDQAIAGQAPAEPAPAAPAGPAEPPADHTGQPPQPEQPWSPPPVQPWGPPQPGQQWSPPPDGRSWGRPPQPGQQWGPPPARAGYAGTPVYPQWTLETRAIDTSVWWEARPPAAAAPPLVPITYPVDIRIPCPQRSSRLWATLAILMIKPFALVPHLAILAVLETVQWIVFLIAQFAVLFRGRYPRPLYEFVAGVERWQLRVLAFLAGLTDRYPPFSLQGGPRVDYPAEYESLWPERSSRLWAINTLLFMASVAIFIRAQDAVWLTTRTFVTLPHLLILVPLGIGALMAWTVAQVLVVVRGAYPPGIHSFITGFLRWHSRMRAFWFGLQDRYPPFALESEPAGGATRETAAPAADNRAPTAAASGGSAAP